jgi:4-aminobutyrate aminotransferase-like enzyme
MASAAGSLIWDADGREYIDLCAGFGALALGHNSKALKEVMSEHLSAKPPIEHAMGDVYPSVEKVLFLETMKKMLPKQYAKGALCLTGSQSVEFALKTAMLATKKNGFLVFDGGYHGLDLGALPLTSREDFRNPFQGWLTTHVERVAYGASEETVLSAINRLKKGPGFAGCVVEPVQGRAGVVVPKEGWLELILCCCRDHGGLLILDEVFTGFGRTGSITAGVDLDADILCFGKAIGGGFPVSACFAKKEVMDAWPESTGEALHTGTFFGHPFSASVGRRTLEAITEENLCENSVQMGAEAQKYLAEKFSHVDSVKNIRGKGLMIGIEFTKHQGAVAVMNKLRAEGVIVLPSGGNSDVLSITPALNIEKNIFFKALDKIVWAVLAR